MTNTAILFLISFALVSWLAPRYGGLIGLLVAHITVLLGYFLLAGLSITDGTYEYDGILSTYGLLLQAFILNCLLLPLGVFALWQRNRPLAIGRTDE